MTAVMCVCVFKCELNACQVKCPYLRNGHHRLNFQPLKLALK